MLINAIAVEVKSNFDKLSKDTSAFSYSAYEIFSPEFISEKLDIIESLRKDVAVYYRPDQQSYKLVVYMLNYLKNS